MLFHEGSEEDATVLAVIRGLHLEGTDFDRVTALEVLRDKYGPEDDVTADESLNLVWGKYAVGWPETVGRKQTRTRLGKGACRIEWRQNGFPGSLRDGSGALVDLRENLNIEGRRGAFHLRWPQWPRGDKPDPEICDYFLEAFHDDRNGVGIFVGMMDIAAYEQAFAGIDNTVVQDAESAEKAKGKKPAVKF